MYGKETKRENSSTAVVHGDAFGHDYAFGRKGKDAGGSFGGADTVLLGAAG
ncbi:hypothetical protein CE91St63_32850 [[Clostridium] hylemonae]|nr:hypothetical protein CE91St63_32850 [[Clostridium] hylemonae]